MIEIHNHYEVTPVILCGGSGTRLWPLSRAGFPKQFLCLTGNESLFQRAAQRLTDLGSADIQVTAPLIVTGEEHRFLASEQLREVGIELGGALLEPIGRNTAPALTLAALAAVEGGKDPVLVVTPADQTITDAAAFTVATQRAIREAVSGSIVILGVTPDRPETGYGYIQTAQGASTEKTLAVTAEITNGDRVFVLTENQSTYIPLGEMHRLSNLGEIPLEIIEVQSGSYLGEDDIVRFEDTYGRHQ